MTLKELWYSALTAAVLSEGQLLSVEHCSSPADNVSSIFDMADATGIRHTRDQLIAIRCAVISKLTDRKCVHPLFRYHRYRARRLPSAAAQPPTHISTLLP